MSDDLLRHPVHSGHLLIGALKRHRDKPVLHLGDTTLTGGQLAERVSQYIQAFDALGAGSGAVAGFLSLNRPEVLMITSAGQTQGYRRLALHPLGSLEDHAYVLADSGATSLIIDPNPMFVERAIGLVGKVDAIYTSTDNNVVSTYESLVRVATDAVGDRQQHALGRALVALGHRRGNEVLVGRARPGPAGVAEEDLQGGQVFHLLTRLSRREANGCRMIKLRT